MMVFSSTKPALVLRMEIGGISVQSTRTISIMYENWLERKGSRGPFDAPHHVSVDPSSKMNTILGD